MATEIILPRVDMDMATGQISRWYIEEGATIEKGQPLFEIETDKAAMEIESPASGILRAAAATGVQVPVGDVVGWIAAAGEDFVVPGVKASVAEAAVAASVPEAPVAAPAIVTPTAPAAGGTRATPLARRLAAQGRVSLALVKGSGPQGRVQADDVRAYLQLDSKPAAAPVTTPAPEAPPRKSAPVLAEGPLHSAWLRSGEGDPLVLVHGFGADLNSWRPLVQALGSHRPVFAIDLPGHGGSPLAAVRLDAIADLVADSIATAGITALHLVGHSLGAAVATAAAERIIAEVKSLFLISPGGLGPDINGAFIAGYARSRSEESLAAWMALLVADPAALSPAFVRATAKARALGSVASDQEALSQILFPDGTQGFSVRTVLDRLAIPVRVVHGRDDRVIPARHALGLPGAVAVHTLPDVGHMPHVEAKDLLARLLQQHIKSA